MQKTELSQRDSNLSQSLTNHNNKDVGGEGIVGDTLGKLNTSKCKQLMGANVMVAILEDRPVKPYNHVYHGRKPKILQANLAKANNYYNGCSAD